MQNLIILYTVYPTGSQETQGKGQRPQTRHTCIAGPLGHRGRMQNPYTGQRQKLPQVCGTNMLPTKPLCALQYAQYGKVIFRKYQDVYNISHFKNSFLLFYNIYKPLSSHSKPKPLCLKYASQAFQRKEVGLISPVML